ncbi:DUF5682 family protein [Kitasatospora acidiphila]|uniref:DUF5682 family protein n=1 Tax=Kitasatospora acidiphila TaxID=2567942 RepID=UPI003C71F00E
MTGEVTLLGVRHHGPGSARAVAAALTALRPDAVLVEGPPEADPIIALAGREEMVPPVALLAHAVDEPARAAFWPFAAFSPEWVAIRHALDTGAPVRFIDLPAATGFALDQADMTSSHGDGRVVDPIVRLAAAAGRADSEAWWEDVVEHQVPGEDPLAPFHAVAEAMTALRFDDPVGTPGSPGVAPAGRREQLREAFMRQQLRAARRAGHRRIAVVCGAWHVPALSKVGDPGSATADRALLAGLPKKARTEITWVPWTHRRLAQHTGYGAGIESPGWYQHLFESAGSRPERALAGWLARAAELLRAADHPVSPAQVIEAVRLAETLAALRGRPVAGLAETTEAVRAVLCDGSEVALALVHDRLVVGEALGTVPADTPTVPLQRDLTRLQRSLRLRPEPEERELVLDLRKELDAGRSRLLHRLRLLGLGWGTETTGQGRSTGTFRESWRLRWDPEFAVRVVEAAAWGTTVAAAAAAKVTEQAARAERLADLTRLAEQCLVAALPEALPAVLRALADRAALDTDTAHLADALPALVRALRYGDVRGTDARALDGVARSLADRIRVGLAPACIGLDAEGATAMRQRIDAVHTAVGLLAGPADRSVADRWAAALAGLSRREPTAGPATGVPGLLRGRAVRLLLDDGRLDSAAAGQRLRLALSRAGAPSDAAGWVEGFLAGGGALLLHDPRLLALLDDWLAEVPEDAFIELLPLLRRTFAGLEAGVRRAVGARVAAGPLGDAAPAPAAPPVDERRAAAGMATVLRLLRPRPGTPGGPTPPPVRPWIPRQSDRRAA